MATVSSVRTNELMVELTAKEVIEAIEQRAWCAAVKDNLQVSVEETPPRMVPDGRGGYRVYYTKTSAKSDAA